MRLLILLALVGGIVRGDAGLIPAPGGTHPLAGWTAWRTTGLQASYFNLETGPQGIRLWFDARSGNKDVVVCIDGTGLSALGRPPPRFDSRVVRGYDRDLDGLDFPIISRTHGHTLPEDREVVFSSIGPRYTGGMTELFPAVFLNREGEWIHLGPPAGDPAEFLRAARAAGATVRCEGGGLVHLPTGQFRLYLHGMLDAAEVPPRVHQGRIAPNSLLIAEAEDICGPWRFLRDERGTPLDLLRDAPTPWTFAHVQPIGEYFLLTGTDAWPPTVVYAAYSRDGLRFVVPADAQGAPLPLLRATDALSGARFGKGARMVLDKDGHTLHVGYAVADASGVCTLYASTARMDWNGLRALLEGR